MIVLGDSLPHDTRLPTDFPSCPLPLTQLGDARDDPGSAFTVNNINYPSVGALHTQPTLQALRAHNTNLSFVTYNAASGSQIPGCHSSMAQYTGGNEVVHGTGTGNLESEIVNLINQAASHVDQVNHSVTLSTGSA